MIIVISYSKFTLAANLVSSCYYRVLLLWTYIFCCEHIYSISNIYKTIYSTWPLHTMQYWRYVYFSHHNSYRYKEITSFNTQNCIITHSWKGRILHVQKRSVGVRRLTIDLINDKNCITWLLLYSYNISAAWSSYILSSEQ